MQSNVSNRLKNLWSCINDMLEKMWEIDKVKIKTEERISGLLDFLLACLFCRIPFQLSRYFFKVDESMPAVIKTYFLLLFYLVFV